MAVRDRWDDISSLSLAESPTIVDGGANEGQTVEHILARFASPTIHAFEPIPECAQLLRDKYGNADNVYVHENALGDSDDEIMFNISKYNSMSSALSPTEYNREQHGENADIERQITVEEARLDSVLDDVDILKLDVQGYEESALRGCEGLLNDIDVITLETMFIQEYEDQPLFGDIDGFLRENGFRLFNLYELSTHENGQLDQADAVYVNKAHPSPTVQS